MAVLRRQCAGCRRQFGESVLRGRLAQHASAVDRVERSRHAARDNPIATAMVERAAAIAAGDHDALVRLTATFARLGCPYQQSRTSRMARTAVTRDR